MSTALWIIAIMATFQAFEARRTRELIERRLDMAETASRKALEEIFQGPPSHLDSSEVAGWASQVAYRGMKE